MSEDLLALVVGTVLSVGALAFVLHPLFFDAPADPKPAPRSLAGEEGAICALREIELDRAMGKLSDADYQSLRARYAERALREMRGEETPAAPAAVHSDDDIEARVRAYRQARPVCERCGLRPEPDALYCSDCGATLVASPPGATR